MRLNYKVLISKLKGYAACALHVIGALKHYIIDKDGAFRRMLGAEV